MSFTCCLSSVCRNAALVIPVPSINKSNYLSIVLFNFQLATYWLLIVTVLVLPVEQMLSLSFIFLVKVLVLYLNE
jgi:hypothetical protein